ncbi:hypothetical protein DDB_G0270408 [Dictyostelium discoideum AX4]|uniref:Uncharacterized protein n=1 Tax=Dictyostelium discoideum TaxID=44689 RepID=Q55BQ1_DICDI|nr:hypothetical protein DDB_G0270408 [Dictyostelium discoideum AX4]EAL72554.1 hypothetical protein DDB_G0270408 [Dictyostelium discoideum AX4]|eukprot:XP_646780.1 hypothetical protein DDB_G0270408 [Dictyostelium discoideum AX4]
MEQQQHDDNIIIEETNNSITFNVCNTIKSKVKYEDFSIDSIMNYQEIAEELDEEGNVIGEPVEQAKEKVIINSSLNENSKFIGCNSFFHSAIKAFSEHHHLNIRPDDIWMAILNNFSTFINKYAQDLRDKLVDFKEGKKLLMVETDYPILKAPHDKLTLEISKEIEKNIKDPSIRDWIIPNFSTTTQTDKVVFASALMSTVKSFFDFKCYTRCGLPSVTLFGTVDDWLNLKERIERLKEFDIIKNKNQEEEEEGQEVTNKPIMSEWVSMLHPIIDEFILTASGKPNIEWWSLIAKENAISGGPIINGWITVFSIFNKKSVCIFDNQQYWSNGREKRLLNPNTWLRIGYHMALNGYLSSPILLVEGPNQYNSTLFGGHMAIKIDENSPTTISPSLDWCLVIDK